MRTLPSFNHEAHDKITKLLNKPIYPHGDCYAFQFNTATDVSWIHSDVQPSEMITKPNFNFWAAVAYLTPNPVISCGTTPYANKTYNSRGLKDTIDNEKRSRGEAIIGFISDESSDVSKWTKSTSAGNVYNRIVVYDALYYHQASSYFGDTKEGCRLLQVFFSHTTNDDINKDNKDNIKIPGC